jgi:hypothetical protein
MLINLAQLLGTIAAVGALVGMRAAPKFQARTEEMEDR